VIEDIDRLSAIFNEEVFNIFEQGIASASGLRNIKGVGVNGNDWANGSVGEYTAPRGAVEVIQVDPFKVTHLRTR